MVVFNTAGFDPLPMEDYSAPVSDSFLNHAAEVVARIAYKNWRIVVSGDATRGDYFMQVRFSAPDSATGEVQHWSGRKWRLSPHMTDSEIVGTALKAVLTAEEHEAREQFTYRGRAVFGPHLDVDRLWELAGSEGALSHR